MKNTFLKTIGSMTLAILMITAFAQIRVSAQEDDLMNDEKSDIQADSSERRANAKKLEGVWDIQVTGRNCQTGTAIRTFPSMFTMMYGGTMKEWGSGNAPSTRGSGHGVWSFVSGRNYTSAFQFFRFNADGTLAGKQIIRQQIELSPDGNGFTSSATAQVLDVNGNVIATNCSTGVGTRFE